MDQRINFITLGVENLHTMKNFYNNVFGWKPVKDDQGIVFYKMNGFILSLFPSNELADDAGVNDDGKGFKRHSLAINFTSVDEVDAVFLALEKKGAGVIRRPEKVFWGGYRGYISDPEGNLWELAYNPFLTLDKNGSSETHA